jgi:hypothetical protein
MKTAARRRPARDTRRRASPGEAPAWLEILAREQIAYALLGPFPALPMSRARALGDLAVDLAGAEMGRPLENEGE